MYGFMQLAPLRPRRRRSLEEFALPGRDRRREKSADLAAIAGRIAGLIDGPVAEALVVMLTELYGDALSRIIDAIGDTPAAEAILDRLCDDHIVGGLLVVHDLHPRPLTARIERALAAVEQNSNTAGAIALDRIEDDVVYVRLASAAGPATRTAIARAIAEAAPEISAVLAEVDVAEDRTLHF
jgi:hypothetical protein